MTFPCDRPNCPAEERRKGERREVAKQSYAWCARVMGAMVVATSLISIASAVSISSFLAERQLADEQRAHAFHQQQYISLRKRVAALEARSHGPR